MEIRFSRSARKHRIGKAHALYVIANTDPIEIPADDDHDPRLVWIGPDDREVEREIVAIQLPNLLLVIHVMPAHYRKRTS